jgi:molybdopterin/thiamine biosynthesis adenylyltransferase
MSRLVLTSESLNQLRAELLDSPLETCAILFGRVVIQNGRLTRIVVREYRRLGDHDYQSRTTLSAQIRPDVVAAATKKARQSGTTLIFAHSHPFPLNQFSKTDDAGEKILAEFLSSRMPGTVHATLLVTPEVTIARVLGGDQSLKVMGVGPQLVWGGKVEGGDSHEEHDRQVRAFGEAGQRRLRAMRVGIIGLGGTGSVVLEQLTHLGVGDFMLIDADVVERTNLNRLVGATEADISKPKVEVAAALAKRINSKVRVETIRDSVLLARVAEQLVDVDFLFACTDSHGSRAVLNQLAYQYLIPAIDMGVVIVAPDAKIQQIAGRTQMLAPGLGCLLCGNLLNPEQVRVDLLTDFERAADPYINGANEPAPAVISLNATMAAMAVTMFLSAAIGIPSRSRYINYDGITGKVRPAEVSRHPKCIDCSLPRGLARANEWPLRARMSAPPVTTISSSVHLDEYHATSR